LQEVSHQTIEPRRLVPLHPVTAFVENVEFRPGDCLEQVQGALCGGGAVNLGLADQRLL